MSDRLDELLVLWDNDGLMSITEESELHHLMRAEIDRLRANQIPGKCGECAERRVGRNSFGQYSYCMWKNGEFDPDGYCDEWKPKEDV